MSSFLNFFTLSKFQVSEIIYMINYENISCIINAEEKIEYLEKRLEKVNIELAKQPDGDLLISRKGDFCNFYLKTKNQTHYLSKKNPSKIRQMVKKRFLVSLKEDIEAEIHALNSYSAAKHHRAGKVESFLNNAQIISFLEDSKYGASKLADLKVWASSNYEKNLSHPESLIHKTLDGHIVRSKSEVMICDLLTKNHIPFHYEERLNLGTVDLYPDFKIIRPYDKKVIYWEHFGLFDNPDYRKDAIWKVNYYADNGFFPDNNLILTYETSRFPLTQQTIQDKISLFLL